MAMRARRCWLAGLRYPNAARLSSFWMRLTPSLPALEAPVRTALKIS